jgi:hypothetical protein
MSFEANGDMETEATGVNATTDQRGTTNGQKPGASGWMLGARS